MEMCWQEADDRPTADDILAFLQQIEEEVTSQSLDLEQTGISPSVKNKNPANQSAQKLNSNFVMSKNKYQSSQHVAEVLVHRVDDGEKHGFEDDFSRDVVIRKNINSQGFEDDFVAGSTLNDTDLPQNDSILAAGGNVSPNNSDTEKDMFAADNNLNLLNPPVPVGMSTPSKKSYLETDGVDKNVHSAVEDNQTLQTSSRFVTATIHSDMVGNNSQNVSPFNQTSSRSESIFGKHSRTGEKSENQNSDEGYRTAENGSSPDIVEPDHMVNSDSKYTEDSESDNIKSMNKLSPKITDLETERAKQIYMSKGAALPPSSIHKSRSLGTIPEDGIPSDNTSQSGVVFDDPEESEDVGMNFEWDDYEGEQLVGRVRYMSDDSTGSARSPRHVEVEEWPFDQDTSSESHSKPGSIASDSDGEVTRLSIGSNTSIDTRARIASILTNRLNSLIKQTNSSYSTGQSMFYSFSEYDNDVDSPEHASVDPGYYQGLASDGSDVRADLSMPIVEEEEEERESTDDEVTDNSHNQGQVII